MIMTWQLQHDVTGLECPPVSSYYSVNLVFVDEDVSMTKMMMRPVRAETYC